MRFIYFLTFSAAMMGCSWALDNYELWWACGVFVICLAIGVWSVVSFTSHEPKK